MSIEVSEEAGVRYLHFGSRWIQGAMRIQRPYALELEYTRAMMTALLLRNERGWPSQALQIGLGAASLTKFLHRHRPATQQTVVEIDPRVVAAARQFFRLPHDPGRISVVVGEGDAWLAASGAAFDLVLVDGFDARGSPGPLDSVRFYRRCRDRLGGQGLMVTNLLSRRGGAAASVARMRLAFDERVLVLPPTDAGNTIAIGAAGDTVDVPLRELAHRADRLRVDTGLNLRGVLAGLVHARGGRGDRLTL
jgi:spermidine synthase